MCGRFLLTAPAEALHRLFGFPEQPNLTARFNISPGQAVAAMRLESDRQRHFVWLRWGLVPAWARGSRARASRARGERAGGKLAGGERSAPPLINARAETVAEKPSFREAFESRRCVVFADGFYEWRQDGNRQPYCIRLADQSPFAFAALWEPAGPDTALEETVRQSCALITTEANAKMAAVHHRMPAILLPDQVERWLDPASLADDLLALLQPLPEAQLSLSPVSKRVNTVKNDDPGLLEESRLPEAPDQLTLF